MVGFEVGADDYVVKPFSVRELVLRVNPKRPHGSSSLSRHLSRLDKDAKAIEIIVRAGWREFARSGVSCPPRSRNYFNALFLFVKAGKMP